jgi:hypothetical protein
MNTIPLAPSSPACTSSPFRRPVTPAVMSVISSTIPDPYFSSSTGPIRRMKEKFETRCAQLACPMTWVNRRTHVRAVAPPRYGGAVKYEVTIVLPKIWSYPSTAAETSARVRVTGAL